MRPSLRLLHSVSSARSRTVGFIGLGRMGSEMANNLFAKSLADRSAQMAPPVFTVCDAVPAAANSFAETFAKRFPAAEVKVVETPAQVALHASTIITMLPSSPHVQKVYLGENSIAQTLRSHTPGPTLCIDSTTLDVEVARSVAKEIESVGGMMVDAPVSGGVTGARAGTLSFLLGGPPEVRALTHQFLSRMGSRIIECGPSGAGLAAKICNNLVLGVQQIVVAEGMLLGQRMGLDPAVLASVINQSTGRCWSSEVNNPVPGSLPEKSPPCERDYEGGFASALMLKDLNLALASSEQTTPDTPLPLGKAAIEIYEKVVRHNEGKLAGKDFSVVYKMFEEAKN